MSVVVLRQIESRQHASSEASNQSVYSDPKHVHESSAADSLLSRIDHSLAGWLAGLLAQSLSLLLLRGLSSTESLLVTLRRVRAFLNVSRPASQPASQPA